MTVGTVGAGQHSGACVVVGAVLWGVSTEVWLVVVQLPCMFLEGSSPNLLIVQIDGHGEVAHPRRSAHSGGRGVVSCVTSRVSQFWIAPAPESSRQL